MINKRLKIAITGGIGSGKSTVSEIIRNFGYAVYDADEIYNGLLTDENIVGSIYDALSLKKVYVDGKIIFDKKLVSKTVFSDKEKLKTLNELSHALVYAKIEDIFKKHDENKPIFFEIPLLFESGKDGDFDKIIVVKRNVEDRIEAVMKRSNLTFDEITARINSQINYDNLSFIEHTLIINDGSFSELIEKVKVALESLE